MCVYSVTTQTGDRVKIPTTRFTCQGRPAGYYADVETGCQIYHMCDGLGRQFSYSCPNTTLFQQRMLICDHWYMVNCSNSESDYDANLLIGQRDKPFVSEEEMRQRTPRPDILSVPPNSNFFDGLRESESKFSIHPGNSIVGIADSISTGNDDLDSDKPNYRPPSSWSTGIGVRSTTPTAIDNNNDNSNTDLNADFSNNGFGTKQNIPDIVSQSTVQTPVRDSNNGIKPPSQDLSLPFLPGSNDGANQLDIRMKPEDPVYNFIKRFDPNSPDTDFGTSMTKSQILDLNKQLPPGQANSEEDRTPKKNKNGSNNFNFVRSDKKKGSTDESRFNSINSKANSEGELSQDVPVPDKHLLPPKSEFPAPSLTTTMGPPIYYEWKWAVPALDLEPPRVSNFTNITAVSKQKSQGKRPFSAIRTTTEAVEPTPSNINTEYNISSYFIPDYVFPLDGPHPGYGDEDAQTSFQVKVSRPGRSSYGENPDCPQCHPAYLDPGLLVNYGDSDEELEDSSTTKFPQKNASLSFPTNNTGNHASAAIHPPPISHCPWSACYDENSGFTYYWNQQTNAVTWEAPPEYLLALKLAQQHLSTAGNTEVSAEEWQLYQQALAEKQNSNKVAKAAAKLSKNNDKTTVKNKKNNKKRPSSESDDEYKIELITSYHNSDSESNDEQASPVKQPPPKPVTPKSAPSKPQPKKQKTKPLEYGPSLPENHSYSAPIGPELPSDLVLQKPKSPDIKSSVVKDEQGNTTPTSIDEDSQDESTLLEKLKDKAKLLEKLGGELPRELQKIIKDDPSGTDSPKSIKDLDIDELLQEIEKKELPNTKAKIDILNKSCSNSPKIFSEDSKESNCLTLFPSAVNINEETNLPLISDNPPAEEKKENIYLSSTVDGSTRKKLRISNSVLPKVHKLEPAQKVEVPAYTTKYSQFIEGFSSERTGLGFSKDEVVENSPKEAINYGNGLLFTKGEVLNEKDEALDDMAELVEAKLKYLSQVQPRTLTPLQEMTIQLQTLVSAFRCGALTASYWRRWVEGAARALDAHEHLAAPPGWFCTFQRSEGRYCYKREADGFVQWEYPAVASTDMDICTTPPPETPKDEALLPTASVTPPPQPTPPPSWQDPPPPGTDAQPPHAPEPKKEIGDELLSFYSDLAELEKHSNPSSLNNSPERNDKSERDRDAPVKQDRPREDENRYDRSEREKKSIKTPCEKEKAKKKSKVKISSSIGMKQKTVSSLVAKWQQVAEEINSD
ncbi:unnamed protein product [Leptosia nina]|uniref:Uncharacterized protein n=1 Tax=Leptosia nina TaxID=320188 RepID=A0AAV1K1Y1_9NEOP